MNSTEFSNTTITLRDMLIHLTGQGLVVTFDVDKIGNMLIIMHDSKKRLTLSAPYDVLTENTIVSILLGMQIQLEA